MTGQAAEYWMVHRMERGNTFTCMKYTLIIVNVFGFILAIFNALFGIGYPHERWPGGYTGGQMAIFSLFVMAFTTVGYCGAHHHKGYLLIVYGFIIFLITIGNVVLWVIYNDKSILGSMNHVYIIFCAVVVLLLLLFTFFLAFKLRQTDPGAHRSSTPTSMIQRTDSANPQSTPQQNNRSNNFSNIQTHPCPVPGCNYGKVITS